jgi:hypothetical protein
MKTLAIISSLIIALIVWLYLRGKNQADHPVDDPYSDYESP